MIGIIKEFVTNIAVLIIFISAVEIISPDNKMKKYVSFVLGIIFMAVMINPIIKLITNENNTIEETMRSYEYEVEKYENNNSLEVYSSHNDNDLNRQFEKKLSYEIVKLLEEKFSNMNFQCTAVCQCNSDSMEYDIKNINIYIKNSGVNQIRKVEVNINEDVLEEQCEYKDVKDFLSNELKVNSDKINIYEMKNREGRNNG